MRTENQFITFNELELTIKREDLLHPIISGNKYRKLKYNLLAAQSIKSAALLTFGGAYSNHIAALAAAGKEYGMKTIGIIRGEELKDKITENPTLSYASACNMHLEFVSREDYRKKNDPDFKAALQEQFGEFYLLPEGGTNALAIKGCEEILTQEDSEFDYICVSFGTGGTMAGLVNAASNTQQVLGFSSLKGDFVNETLEQLTKRRKNWLINTDYHFGGYGKINDDLIAFINEFRYQTGILLDPIYTGKMLYGIVDLARKKYFEKDSKLLVIHTGGLQGIEGVNRKLERRQRPLIER